MRTPALFALVFVTAVAGCERKLPDSVKLDEIPVTVGDPKDTLLTYELEKTFQPTLKEMRGIAVAAQGVIYLAGDNTIVVMDREGAELKRWLTPEEAQCVAVDDEGTIYAGLVHRIAKYDPDGIKLAEWGKPGKGDGEFGLITGIAVGSGSVFAADAANRAIVRFDLNGDYVATFGRPDRKAGVVGLVVPSPHLDCVLDDETIINANPGLRRVEFRDLNGALQRSWGKSGNEPEAFCGCCNPGNLALTPDRMLVTSEKGIARVKVYDMEGRMLAYMGPRYFAETAAGLDLAVDTEGRIHVIDPAAGKLLVFRRAEKGTR